MGYDFLAIKTFVIRGVIVGVGRQIGVGKESGVTSVHISQIIFNFQHEIVSAELTDEVISLK